MLNLLASLRSGFQHLFLLLW